MSVETLLSRLHKVRRSGAGHWTACCPAHNDKSPSLAIREVDDGRVLIHCFGGCSVESVLDAVGLSFNDLFPERDIGDKPKVSRPFMASDVLRLIAKESLIVAASAKTLATRPLTEKEMQRVIASAALIQGAMTASGIEVHW